MEHLARQTHEKFPLIANGIYTIKVRARPHAANDNSIIKSIKSISQKSQFYRRAISRLTSVACSLHFTETMS